MSYPDLDTLAWAAVAGIALLALTNLATRVVSDTTRVREVVSIVVRVTSIVGFAVAALGLDTAARGEGVRAAVIAAIAFLVVGELVVQILDGDRRGLAGLVLGAVAVAAAPVIDDIEIAAAVTVAGVGLMLLVAIGTRSTGVVIAPGAVLLAVDGLARYDHTALDVSVDRVGLGVAAVALIAAVVGRDAALDPDDRAVAAPPLALAGFVAALVLVTQDIADLRTAGLLLAGGATLATAARHPVGLVAIVPGTAAALGVAGLADHPVHAAAGGAIAILTLATSNATLGHARSEDADVGFEPARHWATPLAVMFAVMPLWGWSDADPGPGYGTAVAIGGALIAIAIVGSAVVRARPDSLTAGSLGRRRPPAASTSDGSTLPPLAAPTQTEELR